VKVWIPVALLAAGVGVVVRVGLHSSRAPYPFATVHPSAKDYWIEHREEQLGGTLRSLGGSWPTSSPSERSMDTVDDVLRWMFEDVDGDGREEILEGRREWVKDEKSGEVDGWAIDHVYHRWNGSAFVPRWSRLTVFGGAGPLVRLMEK
jgi:hypothetical protein